MLGSNPLIKQKKLQMGRTIKDYMDFTSNVIESLPRQFEGIVKRNEKAILDLNRENQLYDQGEDATGKSLLEYKPFTIEIKQLIGQPYDRTTLFYSGAFYNAFYIYDIRPKEYQISIFSKDPKSLELMNKYGDIFGLQSENIAIFDREIVFPEITKYIQSYL